MSDPATCEHCKKTARRPRMYPCPKGWFYMETTNEDGDPEDNVMLTLACSEECKNALWREGPGERMDAEPPMEITPTSYGRPDGKVTAIVGSQPHLWLVRCVFGPAWFWNSKEDRWVIHTALENLDEVAVDEHEAIRLLRILTPYSG